MTAEATESQRDSIGGGLVWRHGVDGEHLAEVAGNLIFHRLDLYEAPSLIQRRTGRDVVAHAAAAVRAAVLEILEREGLQ